MLPTVSCNLKYCFQVADENKDGAVYLHCIEYSFYSNRQKYILSIMSPKTDFRVTLESFTTKELMNLIQRHAKPYDKSIVVKIASNCYLILQIST